MGGLEKQFKKDRHFETKAKTKTGSAETKSKTKTSTFKTKTKTAKNRSQAVSRPRPRSRGLQDCCLHAYRRRRYTLKSAIFATWGGTSGHMAYRCVALLDKKNFLKSENFFVDYVRTYTDTENGLLGQLLRRSRPNKNCRLVCILMVLHKHVFPYNFNHYCRWTDSMSAALYK